MKVIFLAPPAARLFPAREIPSLPPGLSQPLGSPRGTGHPAPAAGTVTPGPPSAPAGRAHQSPASPCPAGAWHPQPRSCPAARSPSTPGPRDAALGRKERDVQPGQTARHPRPLDPAARLGASLGAPASPAQVRQSPAVPTHSCHPGVPGTWLLTEGLMLRGGAPGAWATLELSGPQAGRLRREEMEPGRRQG
ncbi:hypothetical protein HPG69_005001 [Diceros bicornis minor]|uniref:Uncharacterized protein n=1 Tax=Diceros bicornis minor TaxID=77932 RepID=A0A7J7ESZ3_DICBM|nr:hypothetical protein HPG69_005001 [Diceros bicornis minor]